MSKWRYIPFAFFVFQPATFFGQTGAVYTVAQVAPLTFAYPHCFLNPSCYDKQPATRTEVPPLVLTDAGKQHYFLVEGRKAILWTTAVPTTEKGVLNLRRSSAGPVTVTRPYIQYTNFNAASPARDWARNYHAVYSGHLLEKGSGEKLFIGFCHGENKNEVVARSCAEATGAQRLHNTIQPNVPINCADSATWSGGKPYRDGWETYNGILSAVYGSLQKNPEPLTDLGPIAWPSMAYITKDSVKTTAGLRHPSSILVGDSIFIFYIEAGVYKGLTPAEAGRQGGVKLIRVHKDSALAPQQYQTYFQATGGPETWSPSLPAGFTKETMLRFTAVKGPVSTDVLRDDTRTADVVRFSVAKVQGAAYFLGVEEYHNWGSSAYYLALRTSTDLRHWSPRQIIYSAPSWEESLYHYPLFLDKAGNTNTEIDADDFYILGTPARWGNRVNRLHVHR